MKREDFARYLHALKSHDYETFKQYYTDDYRAHFDGGTFDRCEFRVFPFLGETLE